MSQQDLADKTGLTKAYVSMLESGERRGINVQIRVKLAEALGVDIRKLLD